MEAIVFFVAMQPSQEARRNPEEVFPRTNARNERKSKEKLFQ